MKILHVVPTYLPAYRYGGPIHSVHALNKYLVRAGAEVDVYATSIDGPKDLDVPLGRPVDRDGVRVYYFKPGRPRNWFYAPEMHRSLRDHVREFDVIHVTSVFLAASTLGSRAAHSAGIPYLISPRGSLMRAPLAKKSPFKKRVYMRMLERWNLEHAAAIHFTANAEKQEYEEAGLPLRRAVVIPNGLDAEALPEGDPSVFRKKIGIDPDKKIVLSLGRLSWKKGFDTLIPAFAKMAKDVPNAILVIAGKDDEGYMPEMQKLIDASAARSSIVLAGEVEGQERSAAYRSASVFALPSYAENFAGSVAEAMHFGVPVVVSPEVGLAEQVRLSGSGSVVEKDENAVAAELIRLMKDGKSALEMGTRGKAFAATLSYEKVAERFIEVYKEMAT